MFNIAIAMINWINIISLPLIVHRVVAKVVTTETNATYLHIDPQKMTGCLKCINYF